MTREQLKDHCEKQMEMCELWAIWKGEEPSGKVYEEHKLTLELLEQTSWIPYKEREPDKDGKYLCCFEDGYINAIIYDSGEFLINDFKPIAWMPLPPSYQGE